MNGDTHKAEVTPGSPATKRKPVPTPRSTLRRPADKDEISRKQLIINSQQVWLWQLVSDFLDFSLAPNKQEQLIFCCFCFAESLVIKWIRFSRKLCSSHQWQSRRWRRRRYTCSSWKDSRRRKLKKFKFHWIQSTFIFLRTKIQTRRIES